MIQLICQRGKFPDIYFIADTEKKVRSYWDYDKAVVIRGVDKSGFFFGYDKINNDVSNILNGESESIVVSSHDSIEEFGEYYMEYLI